LALSPIYLDASILVPLFINDAFTSRAKAFLHSDAWLLIVTDLAAAEFASAIARRVRMGDVKEADARLVFSHFDTWTGQAARRVETSTADISAAEGFLRRLDLSLRAPDAIHIATAQRLGATIATFDDKMAECARALGTAVAAA
jgi:predicted nucleic acid-binding protein